MKKFVNGLIILLFLLFGTLLCFKVFVFNNYSDKVVIKISMIIIFVFYLILFIYIFANFLLLIIRSFERLKEDGEYPFNEIDCFYNQNNMKKDEVYRMQLKIINFYYKKNGKIDKVIKSNKILILYNRLRRLKSKYDLIDDTIELINSTFLSISTAIFVDIITDLDNIYSDFALFLMVIIFAALLFWKNILGAKDGIYKRNIYKYEIELLEKKIKNIERKMVIKYKNEKMLLTKLNAIKLLNSIKTNTKKKKEVLKSQINELYELELDLYDKNYYLNPIIINDKKLIIPYKRSKKGMYCVANDDYKRLIEILAQHYRIENLLYYKG